MSEYVYLEAVSGKRSASVTALGCSGEGHIGDVGGKIRAQRLHPECARHGKCVGESKEMEQRDVWERAFGDGARSAWISNVMRAQC